MTRQLHFSVAWTRITLQGRPSTTRNGQCRYRSPDGRVCSVGALISDAQYNPSMEGTGPQSLGIPMFDDVFYTKLQNCHDSAAIHRTKFIPEFHRLMVLLAKEYNLDHPTPAETSP